MRLARATLVAAACCTCAVKVAAFVSLPLTPALRKGYNRQPSSSQSASDADQQGLMPPPDRSEVAKKLQEREVGEADDMPLLIMSDLPKGSYQMQVPVIGSGSSPLICTEPTWLAAILALQFLGLDYEMVPSDEDSMAMVIEDEYYGEARNFLSMLSVRYVLSDVVESRKSVMEPIRDAITTYEKWVACPEMKGTVEFLQYQGDMNTAISRINQSLAIRNARNKGGPFVEGDDITMGDMWLTAYLWYFIHGLGKAKGWSIPDASPLVQEYAQELHGMAVWKDIAPAPEVVEQCVAKA
ncbi:unnamed protein product [Chrysoparadoxa australica]